MLTKEKITKNAQKFNATGIKYGVVNDDLLELLGVKFITAPCTGLETLYGAYEGGLINHILITTKYAVFINENLPEDKQVPLEPLIRVCLLHQIGKTPMFVPQTSKWHNENKGEMYKFDEDILSFKTGERSVYYALKSGIKLTEDEVYAMHNYASDFGNSKMTHLGERIAAIVNSAISIAIIAQK
tara:strand:- start:80 stop:634 length:555 start_codon:yes stop_codon:yes gene_type:complete